MNYFISALLVASVFCALMLLRVNWVAANRLKILYEDAAIADRMIEQGRYDEIKDNLHPRYASMPSFDRMMWMLWIWDVNKFINLK